MNKLQIFVFIAFLKSLPTFMEMGFVHNYCSIWKMMNKKSVQIHWTSAFVFLLPLKVRCSNWPCYKWPLLWCNQRLQKATKHRQVSSLLQHNPVYSTTIINNTITFIHWGTHYFLIEKQNGLSYTVGQAVKFLITLGRIEGVPPPSLPDILPSSEARVEEGPCD